MAVNIHITIIELNALHTKRQNLFQEFDFFFSSIRRHTRCSRDWSSDVCSSDLVPYLWHSWENACMKEQAIRTTVDIPASLYRKLKEQAAAQGRSIRELILLGVRVTLIEGKRPRSKRVKFPLIASDGPKVDLTNEQIYEHLEFH